MLLYKADLFVCLCFVKLYLRVYCTTGKELQLLSINEKNCYRNPQEPALTLKKNKEKNYITACLWIHTFRKGIHVYSGASILSLLAQNFGRGESNGLDTSDGQS